MDRGLGGHGSGRLEVERGLGVSAFDGSGDTIALRLGDVDRAVTEACAGSLQIARIPTAAKIYHVDAGRNSPGVGRDALHAVGRLNLRRRVHVALCDGALGAVHWPDRSRVLRPGCGSLTDGGTSAIRPGETG